jgi:hypothetical protein
MAEQGTYPLNKRTLAGTDTLTGVVTGQTADVPVATLVAFILGGAATSGPTANRPVPQLVSQGYFDTTLGFMVWCSQIFPAIWVNAAGVAV